MGLWKRLFGSGAPDGFTGALEPDEAVVAWAPVRSGGFLVVTSLGLWLPQDGETSRRIGWHLISKATWSGGALTVVEAREAGVEGPVVLLEDLAPQRFVLDEPAKVPQAVHARVTGAIRSRERVDSPGVWILQRKVPGRDGVVWQARPDAGVDPEAARSAVSAFVEGLAR